MKNDKKQKQRNNKGEHGEKKNLSTFALCRFVFPPRIPAGAGYYYHYFAGSQSITA